MKLILYTFNIILFLVFTAKCFPVNDQNEAFIYLIKYGYFDDAKGITPRVFPSEDSISIALKEFQRIAGLHQTGKLDNETKIMMNVPRCGLKDKIGYPKNSLQGSKWQATKLTYRISKYPFKGIDKIKVAEEISRAFKIWSDVTNLSFEEKKSGRVDIDIKFETGRHGDTNPFDGPGRIVAHAFFPKFGGNIHFDDAEAWTVKDVSGINGFQIAVHQLGHSLGLFHSDEKEAVMSPFYLGYREELKLHIDDVKGIQALYGPPPQKSTSKPLQTSVPSSYTSDAPDLCLNASIDAATRTQDGSTYVFKGDFYWKILSTGIASGYPRKIKDDWDGLEGNLDAAYTWTDGRTYFIKGGRYWQFLNRKMDDGYPQPLNVGFGNGIPRDIDAAVLWSGDMKSYFFKGNQYWQYDSEDDPPKTEKFPKPISEWEGLPDSVDAALQGENSVTYFFKGHKFYEYNDISFKVEAQDPPYPRSTATWLFKCSPPKTTHAPDLCLDASIDAATRTEDGSVYVFKDDFYWKILSTGIADGYPRRINVDWNGLEGNLDAAYTWIDGRTYFIKGQRYWQFFNKEMEVGYPQPLSVRFENGIPHDIDAAVLWSGDMKSYFFKGDQYWRYDSKYDPPKSQKFPKPIGEWTGLPSSVDAALQGENSITYFFKGDKYYAYNDITFKVDSQDPPYPRSTAAWLFKCPSIKISDVPDLCLDPTIDAATRTEDGSAYVFKGDFYWKLLSNGIADGYPRKIIVDWNGLEGNLDAAYTWIDGKTIFIKRQRYWQFFNKEMDEGYPKPLSQRFGNGIPHEIDAAVLWSGDMKSYFFKGNQYWRYDSKYDPPKNQKFPKPISEWEGLPDSVDAALQGENSVTYFFKGDKYYEYNDISFKVEPQDPPYPRSTAFWLFKCQTPKPTEAPNLCLNASIDAAVRTEDGSAYVFKGDFYWKIVSNGITDGYPRKINVDWNGLGGNLDAAFTWIDGKTIFIKGERYWQFFNKEMEDGFPKPINVRFGNGIPPNIDAAVLWSGDMKSYFFKGNQYWRYDSKYDPPKNQKFPKPISEWTGLPDSVDAALQGENSVTYFFKGDKYYAYNDITFKVESDVPYPRSTAIWLFKC